MPAILTTHRTKGDPQSARNTSEKQREEKRIPKVLEILKKMRQFRLTKLATNEYLKQFENNHMLVKYGED